MPGREPPPSRPRHYLLIRRHLMTGELATATATCPKARCCRCPGSSAPPVSDGQPRRASSSAKTASGSTNPRSASTPRSPGTPVLVMAALGICAVTAASLRHRTDTRVPAPSQPDQPPPANPGMIPLTVPETGRLLARPLCPRPPHAGWTGAAVTRPAQPGTTNAPASPRTLRLRRSDIEWLLPY
jgi:hypothetical protein